MKKILACMLAAALLLSGCRGARPLPDGMDEAAVGQAARDMAALLMEGEYRRVVDAFRGDVAEQYGVTPEAIGDVMATVSPAGAYVETEQTLVLGGTEESFGEPYAAAAVSCKYENNTVIYEFSFDTDLRLIGLQVKLK